MADRYSAHIVDVPEHGVRLAPTPDSTIPDRPNDINMLTLGVALAMGAADYEHHPEPRDPDLQTLSALLTGETPMPWISKHPVDGDRYVVCDRSGSSSWRCRLESAPH